jgi:DNA-binding NtrC family response regulator
MSRARVLVVDDSKSLLELMESILGKLHEVTTRADPVDAMRLLERGRFDVVLTDMRMPGASGFDVLAAANRCAPAPAVVVMTGYATIPEAVAAIRQGAFDYIAKPLQADEVSLVVARALQHSPKGAPQPGSVVRAGAALEFREAVISARHEASRAYLVTLMRDYRGNVTHAAKHAGMTRVSLHRLLKSYDVSPAAFKTAR